MNSRIGQDKFIKFADRIGGKLRWLYPNFINRQLTILVCAIAIALSSCVKYDTGVNFTSLNYGEIVEHIQLSEQLNTFSHKAVTAWVASIEQRAIRAQGRLQRLTDREFQVTIPFNNTQELVTKIDRYFHPAPVNLPAQLSSSATSTSKLNSQMQIEQSNLLLAVRNHLIYDIDLRALTIAADPKITIAADNPIDLEFSLHSPWSIKNGNTSNVASVKAIDERHITWQLQPGALNHIEAIFWLPNPLGIGAIFIIIVSSAGYYFKYRQLTW
ncbi:DUF3153 domain-containing protein [Chamaesiphon sp.]|uniref:DUF3153 domain-containing protein n=1 Tax=Chamaesiphon sp. TaxID=2814140 RepID=UPI00359305BB